MRAAALGLALVWAQPAWALSLVISPAITDITAAPGETVSYTVRVSGAGEGEIPVVVYPWDYWHDPEVGRYVAPPGTTPRSASGWVEPVPRTVKVSEDAGAEVLISVSVPRDAEGAHYTMIFAQTELPPDQAGARTIAAARVGSVLLVHVDGTLRHDLDVTGAGFTAPTATRAAGVAVHLLNQGNTDEQPEFRGMFRTTTGEVLGSVSARSPQRILPGEAYSLALTWTGGMEPGAYELVGTVLFGEDQVIPIVYPIVIETAIGSPVVQP